MQRFYFGRFLFVADMAIGACATCLAFVLFKNIECGIIDLLTKDGTALYGAFLAALTALLGFAIASVAIIAGLVGNEPFFKLRQDEHYEDFWKAFTMSIRFLGVAVIVSLIAIFTNKSDNMQMPTLFVALLAIATCVSSLFRSGMNLELVLAAARKAQKAREIK